MKNLETITQYWDELFPNPTTDLHYENTYQLLVAVLLSAQTTDKAVNQVTPVLFKRFPTIQSLAQATIEEIAPIIQTIGLYKTKAKHLQAMANRVLIHYQGRIPPTLEDLITLPGVGRKTASVVLVEGFGIPAFPVDTHVTRIAKRLGLTQQKDSTYHIEISLKKHFPPHEYHRRHHQMILFGRYHCKAIKPQCESCQLTSVCLYQKESKK